MHEPSGNAHPAQHDGEAAGIREVVVFHSSAEELAEHATGLPFAVIADPDKKLYAEFGVEQAPRALLAPRVWPTIALAVVRGLWAIARRRERPPSIRPHGGRLGLPADFLIAPDGRVVTCKYGEHAYDQWPVDEVLTLAARARRAETRRVSRLRRGGSRRSPAAS
ncbi:peroxiredoxin-like family protein [Streptosporangium sp. NPDC049248]|uniref:peroxiredoxin-like family protein n=1 Tax=Streptosporangium sp. NPDC049248 TaxID=3155651 RepID=UPI00341EE385